MKRSYWDCRYIPLKDSYDSRRDIRAVNTLYTSQQDSVSNSNLLLNNNIYLIRKKLNLNIKDFAKLCSLTPDTISKYEISDKLVQVRVSRKIATATGESIYYVGGYDNFPDKIFSERLYKAIFYHGHTIKNAAEFLNIDNGSILRYLNRNSYPEKEYIKERISLYLKILE